MTIIETTYTVSQHGTLKISRKAISGMGLQPGDTVRVAYLSDDGQANIFREFLLTKDGIDAATADGQIAIPTDLLEQAGIPQNADVQVIYGNGAIVLCPDPCLDVENLEKLLHSLEIAADLLSQLHSEPDEAIEAFQQALNEEGADEDDDI